MSQEDNRLQRRVRGSYLVSTISIAMVLFLLGAVTYLILNALDLTDRLKENIAIYVMLDDGLSNEHISKVRGAIEAEEIVREAVFVSKKEAAEQFIAEAEDDFNDFLEFLDGMNPLPDSFEVRLDASATEKGLVDGFAERIGQVAGVNEVVYQKNVVEQMVSNFDKFQLVLLLFGGALLVISLILLNNTVRMTILAKQQTINTMKLVGANGGFIMRPFLGAASLHGLYAGLIATAMFALLVLGLQEGVPEIELLRGNVLIVPIAGGMIVLGIVISLIFTAFAVERAIRQPAGKAFI